jgi:lysophospholipase L1-like esterase
MPSLPESGLEGGQSSADGDLGAQSVVCGASSCDAPNSCCQTWTADGGTGTPMCVDACDDMQAQLCSAVADCQQTNTSTCTNGVCTDMGKVILGNASGGDGGIATGPGPTMAEGDGGIPSGYPAPTGAMAQMCKKVPVGAGSQTPTSAAVNACAGTPADYVCIECLFGGSDYNVQSSPANVAADAVKEAGNYVVTVDIGGSAAAQTQVWAESSRGLLAPVTTASGETATYAFAVDVRSMEGQPNHAGGPGGYPGLDLFFTGPSATPPLVSAIGYSLASAAATTPIVVFMASDSTACDQTGGAYGGWGQMLPEFFEPPVEIANLANSGASSSSFLGSNLLWGGITSRWKAGDYVIIQFGHNDKGVSDATVQANLEKYVTQAKAAKVIPILVSPPARVQFGSGTTDGDQSSLHAVSAMDAAKAEGVAYVDLTSLSTAWYNTLGSQAAALKYHANDSDATHTNLVGAEKLASLVANNMKDQNLPIAKYLRLSALSQ